MVRAVPAAVASAPFLPTGGGFSNVCAINGWLGPSTGSDSTVVSDGVTLAVAEELGVGRTVPALGAGAAVGAGVGVAAGAVAVPVETGVGDCSA